VLIDRVTAVRSAMGQARVKKSDPDPGTNKGSPQIKARLPSKLEIVGGADRLIVLSDVLNQASLFAEARYRISPRLQIGASAGFRIQGNDRTKDIAAQLLIGPTFNFGSFDEDQGLQNAFFFSPKVGATAQRENANGSTVKSGVHPTISLSFGKRFALGKSAAYAPSAGVVKQSGYAPYFVAVPIALSIFF